MDNLVICDRCGSDACYTQEVNQDIKNYQCYGCGFITNTLMKRDSQFFEEQMELLPNLYKELMGEDEEGKVWMPTTINLPSQGMVFANGPSGQEWGWAAVKAVELKEGDSVRQYPGQPHQIKALTDGVIFEVSTEHFDSDSYRVYREWQK